MLKQIYLIITRKCNYACPFCIRDNIYDSHSQLDVYEAIELIDQLSAFSPTSNLIITGGEPFMHPSWDTIICHAMSRFPIVSVPTNGSFGPNVTERLTDLLTKNLRLQISIDGPKAIHDSLRGSGAYDKVINNITRLESMSEKIALSTTVGVRNVTSILDLAQILNSYKFAYWKLSMEQVNNPRTDPVIDIKHWNTLIDSVIPKCNFKVFTQKIFDFELMERFLPVFDPSKHELNPNCGYGRTKIYVTPSFDVHLCSCINEVVGNLKVENMDIIMGRLESYGNISSCKESVCSSCKYLSICNGGCPGYSKKIFGKIGMGDYRCPIVRDSMKS